MLSIQGAWYSWLNSTKKPRASEIAARTTIGRPDNRVLTSKYSINAHSVSPVYSARNCSRCSRRVGTNGGENLDEKADIELQKSSGSNLTNLASRDLIEIWRAGSQDAAYVLWARYQVRLVALVAARLNRKYRNGIAAEDVVQSAMGSFFRVTSGGSKPSIQLESTASAWNILATFTRRKLSRALERETAFKRGGGWTREPLNQLEPNVFIEPSTLESDNASTAVQWLSQVCQAIEAAHQAGVVHGDLTPNNVLVAKDGRIVITDFGFSTHLHPPTKDSDQQLSMAPLGGTPGFAAPEQVSPAFGHMSPATDIYAIGGLAYYLLTGRGPVDND